MPAARTRYRRTTPPRQRRPALRGALLIVSAWLAGAALLRADERGASANSPVPQDNPAAPLFAEYCQSCHSGDTHKGDFRADTLPPDFADRRGRERWLAAM